MCMSPLQSGRLERVTVGLNSESVMGSGVGPDELPSRPKQCHFQNYLGSSVHLVILSRAAG